MLRMPMATETAIFLENIEKYYTPGRAKPSEALKYNSTQAGAILAALGNPPKKYLLDLYKEIIETHSGQFGKLPDLAMIRKIQATMMPPRTYSEPVAQITERMQLQIEAELDKRKVADGEPNHEERARIRLKVMKGDATDAEAFWIKCIDEYGGNWREAVSKKGKT